ncbi:MAG TPA: O-antigen ligase family protein [Nannocystis sp.]
MFTTFFAATATVLTLVLPTLPQGLTIPITMYLGLVALAGFGGFLRSAAARAQLTLLVPWMVALVLGLAVGTFRGNHMVQALEDALPYLLFALGLCAGRAARMPLILPAAALLVALVDGVGSLLRMESWDFSRYRSVYNYIKLVVGHALVGLFCAEFLRHFARGRLLRRLCSFSRAFLVVVVVATVSRGMVLGMVLGWLTSLGVRKPRRAALVVLAGVLAVLMFATVLADLGTQYLRFGQQATVDGRVVEIEECLRTFADYPIFGAGLGAEIVVYGRHVSYVHNMVAYHLWKFGLVGSALFALPIVSLARQALRAPLHLRATILCGAVSVLVYLVTAASYKSYILVPMVGFVVGAALQVALPRKSVAPGRGAPVPEARG